MLTTATARRVGVALIGAAAVLAPAQALQKTFQPLPKVETNGVRPDDVRTILLANDLWDRNVAERNLDGLIDAYADHGTALPQHGEPVIGKAALRGYWGQLLSLPDFHFDTTDRVVRVAEDGSQAYVYGDYVLSFQTPQGKFEDFGNYVLIYERVDGEFKLALDIDNSNTPRASAGKGAAQ